jgi:hypothetical protein
MSWPPPATAAAAFTIRRRAMPGRNGAAKSPLDFIIFVSSGRWLVRASRVKAILFLRRRIFLMRIRKGGGPRQGQHQTRARVRTQGHTISGSVDPNLRREAT